MRLALALLLALLLSLWPASRDLPARASTARTVGTLVVTGVASGNSSAKVQYQAWPGAADYRIYDQANPARVKYAGTVYTGSVMVPSTVIEWNTLDDDLPHTLIVQAVDQLGPVPRANQYDASNRPLVTPSGMLGSNVGPTADGLTSINGQGPYTNTVTVLAQSQPFTVQANPTYAAIPSSSDATGTFFDTFGASDGQPIRTGVSAAAMTETWTLGTGTGHAWDIRGFGIDTDPATTMPFISDGHLMDMVFDGGGPGNSNPLHTQYGSISYVPHQTIDLSGGQMAHLTAEVDQHVDGRRWWQWYVLPHGDLFTGLNINAAPLDADNIGFAAQLTYSNCMVTEFTGGVGAPRQSAIAGPAGHGTYFCSDTIGPYRQGSGEGLDNRSRVDLFFTQSKYALFEDGQLISTEPISPTLPFTSGDVYYSHYLYHSAQAVQDLRTYRPYETYWINIYPYSDERHWQAMGLETLPASDVPSGSWAALASRIQPPAFSPPVFAPPTATPTNTATSTATDTATSTATDTPTSTETAVPTDTPMPTNTATDTPTATPADTSTATDTQTPLPTDTATATATASETATNTPVDTDTATPTETPTDSATATPTSTSTDTPTPTSTPPPVHLPAGHYFSEQIVYDASGRVVLDTGRLPFTVN